MRRRAITFSLFVFFIVTIITIPVGMFLLPKGKAVYYLAVSLNMIKEGNTEGAIEQAKKAVEVINTVVRMMAVARIMAAPSGLRRLGEAPA